MTASQRLTVRASEIRTRLNEIAGLDGDTVTDEIRAETDRLTTEYGTVETQLRAAIVAEDEERREAETRGGGDDAETRELRALQGRASLGALPGRVRRRANRSTAPSASWPSCAGWPRPAT